MGPSSPKAGDTLIALPTLVHRGPGNPHGASPRKVLFFSLRPRYDSTTSGRSDQAETLVAADVGVYDDATQIHVGWVLSREGYSLDSKERRAVLQSYRALGINLDDFGKGEARMRSEYGA